ncbi:hypothetical protein IWW54_004355 [Coemansia sp. RSA 2705]|nr:hypothetical protein IWW54_004355 [Coemansia sp. RSA 2705]
MTSSSGSKIKVVCRVRPFLKSEKPDESVGVEGDTVLRVTNPRDSSKDVKFNFDSCYGPKTEQDVIYRNDVRPLVETVFSGLSATVFCYGVTGAGKTHTIQGSELEPGIIPRALEHIFMHQKRDAYEYDIRVSYYEIYKEAVFDLLRPRDTVSAAGLPIREDANRRIFIAGLSEKRVTSFEQFDAMYQKACGNRRTASTKLNNHSSRSHAILTVQVQWTDDVGPGKTWCGRLHLIDLAGSEDNRRTENGKDRMAESSAINRSLFVLGQVVEALNTGAARIPYRDSKMTRILQDSLGGESLGMMIVNVAPGDAFLQDTHNTLSFATKSREVVNKPVAHEVVEQRWTVSDRLQHHRGFALPSRSAMVSAPLANGVGKRRRSDEPGVDYEHSPAGSTVSDGVADIQLGARRRAIPGGRHSDTGALGATGTAANGQQPGLRRTASAAPRQADLVQRAVKAKVSELEQRTESASNQIMERVMRIEQQLSTKQLDSDVVFDLFTPATKLKTSRGWLKHARELEQKGDLERALVHYQEALRYAPELNKLDTHIAKLRAKLRRQNRRSSIASQGAANLRIADQKKPQGQGDGMLVGNGVETDSDDDDVGPLWMRDGLAESPGAEKAKRRDQTKPARAHQPKPAAPPAPATKPADKPAIKRRRVLGDSSKRAALAAGKKFTNVTEGSVHDRRISFGGSQNPFVVGGNEFNSELQRRLDKPASLCTKKLVAKSAAAAQLRRTARQPPPTPDDRNDKDFVPQSASSSEDSDTESLPKLPNRANGRRGGRIPGSLGVRSLVERRRQQAENEPRSENVNPANTSKLAKCAEPVKPRRSSHSAEEECLQLNRFNDICIASALQMINSAEVKKIMKLQGIGKRRAEQIQASVQGQGPLKSVSELQSRLQFKNKIIMGILSTFA